VWNNADAIVWDVSYKMQTDDIAFAAIAPAFYYLLSSGRSSFSGSFKRIVYNLHGLQYVKARVLASSEGSF